jgi:hypothetical protein
MRHRIGSGTLTREDVPRIRDVPVLTSDGEEIGHVGEIYYEEVSGRVECVGVPGDAIGFTRVMVPVAGAQLTEDGLRLAFSRDQLRDYGDLEREAELDEERWDAELMYYSSLGVPALMPAGPPPAIPMPIRDADRAPSRAARSRLQRLRRWEEERDRAL